MKLHQLRSIVAIRDHHLHISHAAEHLFTTQPALSKQLRLLEDELGSPIFERAGKNLVGITAIGKQIMQCADEILLQEEKIKALSRSMLKPDDGSLNIYTSHAIARYILPEAIQYFVKKYPDVSFHLFSIQPSSDKGNIPKGYYDFSIIAQERPTDSDLIMLPAYRWDLSLIFPTGHPLLTKEEITLEDLVGYPLLSYDHGATGRTAQDRAFASLSEKGFFPNYYMTSMDSELIKSYVKFNFGIGIIASVATTDIHSESGLVARSASHLFRSSTATLCFRKGIQLQKYNYDLIYKLFNHLDQATVEKAVQQISQEKIDLLFMETELALY